MGTDIFISKVIHDNENLHFVKALMFEGKVGFPVASRDIPFDISKHCLESESNTAEKQFVFAEQKTQHLITDTVCISFKVNKVSSV